MTDGELIDYELGVVSFLEDMGNADYLLAEKLLNEYRLMRLVVDAAQWFALDGEAMMSELHQRMHILAAAVDAYNAAQREAT
jgi:hypothetical protein